MGEVLSIEEISLNCGEGEQIHTLDSLPPSINHYLHEYEWVIKPAQPHAAWRWSWEAKHWFDPRGLQDLQEAKWAEISRSGLSA